jgi:two-component system chemotaxis response regulator CheY
MTQKILIVDDSSIARQAIGNALKAQGFDVVTAYDGFDGLVKWREHHDLALILTDFNMPNMDGMAMAELIKMDNDSRPCRIVMLSAEGSDALKTQAKDLGIIGWVTKPYDADKLAQHITTLLSPNTP